MSRNETLQFINIAHFFDHFFLLIFPTAALALAPAWDMTYAEVLLLGTPLYVMFALGTLPAGWLGDRVDRMLLIAVFFVGCGAASLLIALATGPGLLMVGLGILGVFTALYHPVGLAHVTDIGKRTGRALAINGVFGNMGLAGGALVTGIVASLAGWQAAFALPGLVSIVIGAVLYWRHLGARKTAHAAPVMRQETLVTNDRRVQFLVYGVILIAALFGGIIFNALTISLPKFFDERLVGGGGDLGWIGAATGAVFAIAAFAQLPVGELLDRFGARPILVFLLSGQIVLLIGLSQATGWVALALAFVMVTMVFAEIPITSWLLSRYIKSDLRSRALSVEYIMSLGMASAIVPSIAFLHRAGYGFEVQFLLLAGSAFVVLVASLFLPKHTGAQDVEQVTG
ncbi:MAG: MFS transporter [Paracoccaceae bacterium]